MKVTKLEHSQLKLTFDVTKDDEKVALYTTEESKGCYTMRCTVYKVSEYEVEE